MTSPEKLRAEIEKKGEWKQIWYETGIAEGKQQEQARVIKLINSIFKDDSIYSGRVVKFEIKNNLQELKSKIIGKRHTPIPTQDGEET
jgi:hypothetical protein